MKKWPRDMMLRWPYLKTYPSLLPGGWEPFAPARWKKMWRLTNKRMWWPSPSEAQLEVALTVFDMGHESLCVVSFLIHLQLEPLFALQHDQSLLSPEPYHHTLIISNPYNATVHHLPFAWSFEFGYLMLECVLCDDEDGLQTEERQALSTEPSAIRRYGYWTSLETNFRCTQRKEESHPGKMGMSQGDVFYPLRILHVKMRWDTSSCLFFLVLVTACGYEWDCLGDTSLVHSFLIEAFIELLPLQHVKNSS